MTANGSAHETMPRQDNDEAAQQKPNARASSLAEQLDAQLRLPIGVMFRGILVSSPGVPADAIMKSMCRLVAEMIGNAIVGDLAPVLTIRRECKEAFDETLTKTPINPNQQPGSVQPAQKLSS